MTTETSNARRLFLQKLLAGSAAAGMFMVYRQPLMAAMSVADDTAQAAEHDYGFVVDVSRCIGCGQCVKACSVENDVPEGQYRTWIERYVVTAEGVHVDSPQGGMYGFDEVDEELAGKAINTFFVPKLCNHCAEAPCIQVCPVGATYRSPEGFVLVDPEHCIGCSYCVQACPYGVRFINDDKHIADKCTWCYHRVSQGQLPACVTVCPTQARLFGDLNDPNSRVAKVREADNWDVLKADAHTESMCLYVGLPRVVV
ncbi:MAG: 4Fe-4S dicluster domain-containing protein [Gammaproteobacteria bacterium]